MSLGTPATFNARIGSDRDAFTVQLLKFPRSDAPLLDKVQAFAYFEEVLHQHRSQLTSLTIQQAYATNIPVSSSASASEEANRVSNDILASFFRVENLTCLGFFHSDGSPASIALAPCDRTPDITFVSFAATVYLPYFNSALGAAAISSPSVQFFLKLPQSIIPAKSVINMSHDEPAKSPSPPMSPAVDKDSSSTPDTANMTLLRTSFADNGNTDDINFEDPAVLAALKSIIKISTADKEIEEAFTPRSTKRQLFPPAGNSTLAAPSPSIRRYITNASSFDAPSYCGPMNFLDSQHVFDVVFPTSNRSPIFTISKTDSIGPDTTSANTIEICLAECRMLVFKAMLKLDYIGHHNVSSAEHLQMTVKRLRNLSLKFNTRGVCVDGNPDLLFDKYLALIPLLSASHVNIWGINLFTQYWHALGETLTRRISVLPRYLAIQSSTFDLTRMTTKNSQMTALRELRSLAVESWNTYLEDKSSMRAMLAEFHPRPSNHFLESTATVDASAHVSSAEETMQKHAPEYPSAGPAITTNYQHQPPPPPGAAKGDFAPDFRGCLGCGGPEHIFKFCPMKNDPATIERFHRNFNFKFNRPQQEPRSRSSDPFSAYLPPYSSTSQRQPPGGPPAFGPNPTPGAGRGDTRNRPSWMTQQQYSQQQHSRTQDTSLNSPPKKPRNYALFVRSCQHTVAATPPLRPMPIRVDNGLPHVRLLLGVDADATLSVLFDSGAALSSGYLPYHLWIMRENPAIVASFERFDDSNPFEPIKLGGAIRHPDDYNESLHGQLTAIIRYKTPYVDHDGNPIHISFGLGNDMTVNTILGMPIIKDLGMLPNFRSKRITCEDTTATFDIQYHETSCGFSKHDEMAATFSLLPLDEMYPASFASADIPGLCPAARTPDSSVNATDDHTAGFLQRRLHSA
jgi:hypothetical protein